MDEKTSPVCYEIRVRGQLGGTLLGAFPDLHAQVHGTETVLTGPLADQAALYGLLAQIEALGLELLEVRRPALSRLHDGARHRDRPGQKSPELDDVNSSSWHQDGKGSERRWSPVVLSDGPDRGAWMTGGGGVRAA